MDITIETADWDHPAGRRLRAAQRAELDERYGCDDHEPGAAPTAEDIALFLLALTPDGEAVGCGGLRLLTATAALQATGDTAGIGGIAGTGGVAEIKRMYVRPEARGTGVAVAVLRRLEVEAAGLGVTRLVLETGTSQPDAIRFYEREGYLPTPKFGAYADSGLSLCFGRDLALA